MALQTDLPALGAPGQPPAHPTPIPLAQVFPKALGPDEPQFYLGTVLLFPFLFCALVLETTWVWLPVSLWREPPPPLPACTFHL